MQSGTFAFGPFRLEVAERRLLRDGETVPLRPKVFDTLVALVNRSGSLVEKDDLMLELWPDSVVEEGNLATTISTLRRALGDSRVDIRYIATVPKRGYRFVAEVRSLDGPAAAPVRAFALPAPPPRQEIRFTTTADRVRIAYAVAGEGPPLVKTANWLNHLEFDWRSPVWVHLMRELSRDHTLIRYDERGNGLSDWDVEDLSFEAFVRDLDSVVEAAGLERFALLGISQGCAVSIAYAIRHPERVTRMVLHGGYAKGWRLRTDREEEIGWREGLVEMIRTGWGRDVDTFRRIFASIYIPGGTPEQQRWWTELQRVSTSPENAVRLLKTLSTIDIWKLLPEVQVPTLVTHCRGDVGVPFDAGRALAARIPGARFLPLASDNHLVLEQEPAWPVWLSAVRSFLAEDADSGR
ncbi:MAG TPA: alpha/beta fold hydrolase [Gemmatimonadota bacterium]|nr:alpha/beta fold hydrolase [Gemmatimonadota bacterium]